MPQLGGVYDSDPDLHDGGTLTLEQVFSKPNPQHLHGEAHELSPDQMNDLLAHLRQLWPENQRGVPRIALTSAASSRRENAKEAGSEGSSGPAVVLELQTP